MLEAHYSVRCIRAQRVCIYLPCAFLHVCVHARCSQLYPAVLASLLVCSVTVCQGRCFKRAQGLFQISLADVSHPCHVSSFFSPPHLPVILTPFNLYFLNQTDDHLII